MQQPPRLARLLLSLSVGPTERSFLLDDLHEEFAERMRADGYRKAARWYRSQALRSAFPSILRRLRRPPARPSTRGRFVLAGWGRDLAYSARRLRKTPVYSLVVLATITLGVGALTAVYAVVDAVLIESLPVPDPHELVLVHESDGERGGATSLVSPPNFLDWRERASDFVDVAAMSRGGYVLTAEDRAERIVGAHVSSDFFRVIQAAPGQGRYLTPDDERPGAEAVVVVSHGFWRRHVGQDAFVPGETIVVDDVSYRIVGVLDDAFRYLEPLDVWIPLRFGPDERSDGMRGARYLNVIGRVDSRLTIAAAGGRFADLARQMQVHPNNRGWGVTLTPLRESAVGEIRPALLLLFGAVVFILLIVCANVATLVLSRATGAWREIALRTALGASRAQIFRQAVIEQGILAFAGAAAGAALASASLGFLVDLMPNALPPYADVGVRGTPVLVAFLVAGLTAIVLSATSMAVALRMSPSQALRNGASAGQTRRVMLARSTLITTEIALAIVLLVGATLMGQSFIRLRNVDLGFTPERVFTTHHTLPNGRYPESQAKAIFTRQLTDGLTRRREVQAAAVTTNLPMSGSSMQFGYSVEGVPMPAGQRLTAQYHAVSPDYFSVTGIPFRYGETFQRDDDGPRTVIVNETLARRIWSDANPVGRRMTVISQNGPVSRVVVGVVADVRHADPTADATEEVYVPFGQDPWPFFALVVKSEAGVPTGSLAAILRDHLATLDPSLPPGDVTGLEDIVAGWRAPLRFQMTLVGAFAITALALAAVGIYGVIAYFVGSRVREIGVRMAVGAARTDILGLVVLRSLGTAMVGVALGVGLSAVLTRALRNILFEVSPYDPATFIVVPVLMLVVAALASFLPARRAARINPVDALRTA